MKSSFEENLNNLPICLTYTNKQTDYINNKVRKISTADVKDGGEGAVYIFLKSNKKFTK